MPARLGRAPFQVLVLPYLAVEVRQESREPDFVYALFRRADTGCWQGVAGGGEDDESPFEAARRELREEAGLGDEAELLPLDSTTTVPVVEVTGDLRFGPDVLVLREYAFGARCSSPELHVGDEHTEYAWFSYEDARRAARWDSNRSALWELDFRLRRGHRAGV